MPSQLYIPHVNTKALFAARIITGEFRIDRIDECAELRIPVCACPVRAEHVYT